MDEWPRLIHILLAIIRKASFYASESMPKDGLTYTQMNLLTELFRVGGEANQATLAAGSFYDKSVVSRQLSNLVEMGLVELCETQVYPCKRTVRLTDAGNAQAMRSFDNLVVTEQIGCKGMTEKEKKQFLKLLKNFYAHIVFTPTELEIGSNSIENWPLIPHYIICIGHFLEQEALRYKKIDKVPPALKYILFQLYHAQKPMNFKSLEKVVMMEQSGTVKIISRLEKEGFIEVFDDENDKRKKNARITELGIERALFYLERFKDGEKRGCKAMKPEDKNQLLYFIQRYYENTNQAYGEEINQMMSERGRR